MKNLKISGRHGIYIALVLLAILFSVTTSGTFLSARNLSNLSRQIVVYGIMSMGMTMILLMGGIDLSVGALAGFGGLMVAVFSRQLDWPDGMAIAAAIVIAGLIPGFINGFVSEKFRFHPFITTLGMMSIARGITLTISSSALPVGEGINFLGFFNFSSGMTLVLTIIAAAGITLVHIMKLKQGIEKMSAVFMVKWIACVSAIAIIGYIFITYMGMPLMFLFFFLVAMVTSVLLNKTTTGKYIYSIGGNNKAARLSGLPVLKTWTFSFMFTGALAAFAGILLAGRLGAAAPMAGSGFELNVIAACVIGGTSLSGGVGSVRGTVIGTILLGLLANGMSLWNLSSYVQQIVTGSMVILAVVIDSLPNLKLKI